MRLLRIARRLVYAVVALGILVALGATVLESSWFKDRLRRIAMSQASKLVAGDLTVQRLSGSLLHGVVLDDVSITETDGVVLHATRISVSYDPLDFVRRRWIIGDVVLDQPTIRIADGPSGWNVAHLLKPKPSSGHPLALTINRLRVVNGDVTIQASGAEARHLTAVNVDGRIAEADGHVVINIASATLRDEQSGFVLRRLSGSLQNGIDVLDVTFDSGRDAESVGGRVQGRTDASGHHLGAALDVAAFDLRAIVDDARWATDLTLHADVQADLPPGADGISLNFRVAGPHAVAFGYEGTDFTGSGTLARGRVAFDASATGYGGHAAIHAAWQIAAIDRTPRSFLGTGTFRDVSLARLPATLKIPPLESQLAGQFTVRDGDSGWGADVVLDASTVEDAAVAQGTTGHFSRKGTVTDYSARGHVAGLDLQRIAAPLDLPVLASDRFRSQIGGDFQLSGREGCATCPSSRMLTASAVVDDASIAGSAVKNMSASMDLAGAKLAITAKGDVLHLNAEAIGAPTTVALDLNGTIDGTLTIPDIHAPFTATSIETSGVVTLAPSTVQGVAITAAHVDGSLAGGQATIRVLTATGPTANVVAYGTLAIGGTGTSSLALTADTDDLRVIGQRLGLPIVGAGRLTAKITGSSDHPVAAGSITSHQVGYGADLSALTLNTDFTADVPGWDRAQAVVSTKSAATFVKLGSVNAVSLSGDATYQHSEIDLNTTMADEERQLSLAGRIAFEAASRTLTFRTLAVSTGGATWALPDGTAATVREEGSRITVRGLILEHAAERVSADGAFALRANEGPAATDVAPLVVKADQFQLADINRLLLGTRHLEGLVNGSATVGGTLADPVVDANVEVTTGMVETTPFEKLSGRVRVQSHDVTVDATLVQSGANELTATGHVPFGSGAVSSGRPLDITLKSTPIDLGLAQLLTAEVTKIGGTGEIDLHVTGSPQAPLVDGAVRVTNGAFTVAGSGVSYRGLTADLGFTANHLAIKTFQLTDSDGHQLRADGGLDVLGDPLKRALNVHISANAVHVLENDLGALQMNADVQLTGDLAQPTVSGQIALDSGRLEVDRILERTTKNPYSETPEDSLASPDLTSAGNTTPASSSQSAGSTPVAPTASLFDRVTLSVALNLPDNLVMRGRGLRVGSSSVGLGDMNVIAGGTLQIHKPKGAPLDIVGDLQVVRGTYSFQGQRFDVQRGSDVRFAGQDVTNPALNVTAERDVSGVAAFVHLKGTPSRPDLSLSSQPPLEEAEILSLVMFGQSLNDLGQGERTSLAARAGTMAAGAITTPLADSVARALNLDVFEILAPTDTEKAPVVSLGSQVGSRVYVGVKHEIGRDESSAVTFEYRFARFLRLVTSFTEGALQDQALTGAQAGGIDLMFAFRY